ncbi:MAG: AAA family ATPase [Rhodospirillales bacterium]|nr:AAA family ATPase [Rhodospirillales bacterium]
MPARKLSHDVVCRPSFAGRFDASTDGLDDIQLFDLSSHALARDALDFALSMSDPGYNVFVLGEDRSGRMDATLEYLEDHVEGGEPASDWVYLNNFRRPHKPRPVRLPAGKGRQFRDGMAELLPALTDALKKAFTSDAYADRIRTAQEDTKAQLDSAYGELRQMAHAQGLDVWSGPQGLSLVIIGDDGKPLSQEELMALPDDRRAVLESAVETLDPAMMELRANARRAELDLMRDIRKINRNTADETTGTLLSELEANYSGHQGLTRWLAELRADILDNLHLFQQHMQQQDGQAAQRQPPQAKPVPDGEQSTRGTGELNRRYAVNLLVDNGDTAHPNVVLEPNPTYENVFGAIEYLPVTGTLHTDFTMIRGGALHRANGGILVLRADAIAAQQVTWHFLKGALRDHEIRIEELHRYGSVPLTGTPKPKPIPLDVKVVLVGAPVWYHRLLGTDPEFRTNFKVKAEINPQVPANDDDVALFARLIQKQAVAQGRRCDGGAIDSLMGHASRWADNREKLSSRFELIADLLSEAGKLSGKDEISGDCIERAIIERRRRNGRPEAHSQERITDGTVMIDTDGSKIGQVNGMVYLGLGDHSFGLPSRITARTYAGAYGIMNIERRVAMGGPIQQKGAMIVEGYLNGLFARRFPLSFSCSITFEQSYGGVEGDSASLAETCAILSSLAGLTVRQDIAMTGSLNQAGEVQAIGGANHKIEGFFRSCAEAGLTGKQGAIIPVSNERNLILKNEVVEAMREDRFHVWSVTTAAEAIELLTGVPAGEPDANGVYPPDTVLGRAMAQLERFDTVLTERGVDRRATEKP